MDRRSWPWKKKPSGKTVVSTDSGTAALSGFDQDKPKTVNYVQISKETHRHLMELEHRVMVSKDEVEVLNDKLSTAQADLLTKDNLVKQHAKVAEEAVSGWEKAEAEALALKNQLESVTLLKLTAEERACHLEGAVKECMKQIRSVKEEGEQKLHDVIFAKTKQWEKVKYELDAKIVEFEQVLLSTSAENDALSRSLQERSNMLMKVSDEKARAEAEIEIMTANVQSCEREINSLKYEVQVVSKELEIRNEEKNMSVRCAEVANKQHLDDIKKIAKLEAECQRLRGLVKKKLPGPAALARMKQEVESLGCDPGESRLHRSAGIVASPRLGPIPDFAHENIHQFHRENEFLTARLVAMEEETKLLKEALSRRNNELLTSRNLCAKTSSKLRSLEAHMLALDQQKSPLKTSYEVSVEGAMNQNGSTPPSLTSVSEDGIDEDGSCSDSWAAACMSELSHFNKEMGVHKHNKVFKSSSLDLMDDFLEMEKLAYLSSESNGNHNSPAGTLEKIKQSPVSKTVSKDQQEETSSTEQHPHPALRETEDLVCSNEVQCPAVNRSVERMDSLSMLKSKVSLAIDSQAESFDTGKLLNDIKQILHDTRELFPQLYLSCNSDGPNLVLDKHCPEDMGQTAENGISLSSNDNSHVDSKVSIDQELKIAISQIHDFVTSICKEVAEMQCTSSDSCLLGQTSGEFSDCVSKVLYDEISFGSFIVSLSRILCEIKELNFHLLGQHRSGECASSDCIDKATLLYETGKVSVHCAQVLNSDPYPDNQSGDASPGFEVDTIVMASNEELVKLEKDSLQVELARCTESLAQANTQLLEMEKQLMALKAQLAESHNSNSLAETQLKCMTESYKALETRAQELENKISILNTRSETLDNELQRERINHQNDLDRCKDLEEQLQRYLSSSTCTHKSDADTDVKMKQEREIAAAAEKLAECQETILVLGRQLKAMRSATDVESNDSLQVNDDAFNVLFRDGSNMRGRRSSQLSDHPDLENIAYFLQRTGCESPLDGFNPLFSPPRAESGSISKSTIGSKHSKHRSSSSCSSSNSVPEARRHGFSRFFSKGKSDR